MKSKRVIGIDPGFKGGIALLYNNSISYMDDSGGNACPMPIINDKKKHLNLLEIVDILNCDYPDLVVIEKQAAMPKQGVVSMFRLGEGYWALQGICVALGIPFILVRSQDWKAKVLQGYDWKGDSKAATILSPSPRAKVTAASTEHTSRPLTSSTERG